MNARGRTQFAPTRFFCLFRAEGTPYFFTITSYLLPEKKTASAVFFLLRSVVEDLVVIVVNKVGGLDEGISVGGQFFEDDGQRFGCVVGIVVEQHDTARLDPPRDPCNDAVDRGRVLPIKAVNIRNKSNIIFIMQSAYFFVCRLFLL